MDLPAQQSVKKSLDFLSFASFLKFNWILRETRSKKFPPFVAALVAMM